MSYEGVDPAIRAWVSRHGLILFDHMHGFPDLPVRSVYTWSTDGECFQIWVAQTKAGNVRILASSVETRLDEEFHQEWQVLINGFGVALEDALAQVKQWIKRK